MSYTFGGCGGSSASAIAAQKVAKDKFKPSDFAVMKYDVSEFTNGRVVVVKAIPFKVLEILQLIACSSRFAESILSCISLVSSGHFNSNGQWCSR